MNIKVVLVLITLFVAMLLSTATFSGSVDIPHNFVSGSAAKSVEVNSNFGAIEEAVDDNDSRISSNSAGIFDNSEKIATNNSNIVANDTEISNLIARSWKKLGNDLYHDNGKVGIGTASPGWPLEIKADPDPTRWDPLLAFDDSSGVTKWHFNLGNPSLEIRGLNFAETGSGDYRLFIQEGGNVGVGTSNPIATLDINGYMKLSKNISEPASCDSIQDGSLALTSGYRMCVCNGNNWVFTTDGVSSCSW